MTAAIVCAALLALLLFVLGLMVSVTRGNTKTSIGYKEDPTDRLHKLVRAHSNTAEYAPMLALLYLFLDSRDPAGWIRATIWATTACRFFIVAGLVAYPTLARPNPLRFVGALGTYIGGIVLAIAAVMTA